MALYHALMFLSALKGTKRDEKRSKTMRVLDDHERQKLMLSFKQLLGWSTKIVVWVSDLLLSEQKSIKKVSEFAWNIQHAES